MNIKSGKNYNMARRHGTETTFRNENSPRAYGAVKLEVLEWAKERSKAKKGLVILSYLWPTMSLASLKECLGSTDS